MNRVYQPQALNEPQDSCSIVLIGNRGGGPKLSQYDTMKPPTDPPLPHPGPQEMLHHLHLKVSQYPPGYNCHGGGQNCITLHLGHVSVAVNLTIIIDVVIEINRDVPNGKVDLDLEIVVKLDLDAQNGRFQYQKATHHPVNINVRKRRESKLLNLPRILIAQTSPEGVEGGGGSYFGRRHGRNVRDKSVTVSKI